MLRHVLNHNIETVPLRLTQRLDSRMTVQRNWLAQRPAPYRPTNDIPSFIGGEDNSAALRIGGEDNSAALREALEDIQYHTSARETLIAIICNNIATKALSTGEMK
jgi:hypothetical protein